MRIAVLCATRRGLLFLQKLKALIPECDLVVLSFREESCEPPFLDAIQNFTESAGGRFHEARDVGSEQYKSLWDDELELMLVVSWRYWIPPRVYRKARRGTFVLHDSLLPKYRGFAPTVWAILNGEQETGATLFEIAQEIDSGDIVDQQAVAIGEEDHVAVVMERMTAAYLDLLERNLEALLSGTAPRLRQDHSLATYTCKRLPEDNLIDWSRPTSNIYNLVRATSWPYPGAYTFLNGRRFRVWSAKKLESVRRYVGRVPGRVVEVRPGEGSVALTGDGALLLTQVQAEDGPVCCASEIFSSFSQTLGRSGL